MRFRVNGTPAPQGSKRVLPAGGRPGARAVLVENSAAVAPWREAVKWEAIRANGHDPATTEPVAVTIVFVLKRPASHYRTGASTKHLLKESAPPFPAGAGRMDIDKLARSTLDGLVMGGLMADDGQVVALNAAKVYARNGEAPGAVIDVEVMP